MLCGQLPSDNHTRLSKDRFVRVGFHRGLVAQAAGTALRDASKRLVGLVFDGCQDSAITFWGQLLISKGNCSRLATQLHGYALAPAPAPSTSVSLSLKRIKTPLSLKRIKTPV